LIWRFTNKSGSQYGFISSYSSGCSDRCSGVCFGDANTSYELADATPAPGTSLFAARPFLVFGRIIFVGRFIVIGAISEAIMNDDDYMNSIFVFISVSILYIFKYNHKQLLRIYQQNHRPSQ
jgi:hypothetical protein